MQKLNLQTPNKTEQHIEQIAKLFPNVVSEGKVDFDLLQQMLSSELVEGADERYRLDWVGKKASLLKANSPINKTLRPCEQESVEFDRTENLYIEGDNFEVLKLIQESYLGKVKMIYIDPPYNTGKDFVYRDNFTASKADYEEEMGLRDEEENKLFKNTDSNGRFHSDWLSMMYERLLVSRDLLKEDGVIFISIDDNEVHNLRKICDEVFGESNFLETLIWKKRATPPNDRNIGRIHEYIICYAKESDKVTLGLLPRDKKSIARYSNPNNDSRGDWVASDLSANGKGGRLSQTTIYPILNPITNEEFLPSEGRCWLFNQEKMNKFINEGRIGFRESSGAPYLRRYLSEVRQGLTLPTMLTEFGFSSTSASELDKLFVKKGVFEYAKPTTLLKALIRIGMPYKDDILLDFFSGSATTADSLFQLNSEDTGSRKFIMVQLPEVTNEKSQANKLGYATIPQIAKERIQRAGKNINEKLKMNNEKLVDVGFRVLKLDSSNMKDVYFHPTELGQSALTGLESNIKSDRNSMDLLFSTMLELGIELSLKITPQTVDGTNIYVVADGELVACFAENISTQVIDAIRELSPLHVVLKDGCFANDNEKINGVERLSKVANVSVL